MEFNCRRCDNLWPHRLGENFTKRECTAVFTLSLLEAANYDDRWRHAIALTFTGFLEALARTCEVILIPTATQLLSMGARDIVDPSAYK